MKKLFTSNYTILLLFLLIIFLRFYNLDADPSFTKRVSDISDEAIWGSDARTITLFNGWGNSEIHFGLDSAPLYTYLLKLIFENLGISLFTLRLLSAISGSLTAILLFFFVKKLATKSQAVLALALYGLGSAPFIYNRIGHIESTLTLFLFLMFIFWYLGKNTKGLYFLSGLCYGIAFLIKFTALFFAPALLGYWLYEYFQKRWRWNKLFYFAVGAAIPVAAYMIIFLIPNWSKLSESMLAHGNNNFFGAEVMQNSLKVLGNNIFGLPTVMILFVLMLIYFLYKLSTLQKLTMKDVSNSLTPLEAISLSWIVLGTAGALLSDLSDRRLTIMFVPVMMLVSHMILNWKDISVKELVQKISNSGFLPNKLSKIVFALIFLLPLFSLPYVLLRLLGENTTLFRYGSIAILISYLAGILLWNYFSKKMSYKILLFQFILFAVFTPFTVFLRHFTRHGAILISAMKYEKYLLMAGTASFFIVFAVITIIFYRKEIPIKKRYCTFLVALYFIISFLLIAEVIFFPKFTTLEATDQLLNVTKPDNIIFGESVEIVYGTGLEHIYYSPYNDRFGHLNQQIFSRHPRYFSYPIMFDGKDTLSSDYARLFEEIQKRYHITLRANMKLYPYPFSDKHKIELEVYEITYPSQTSSPSIPSSS